MIHSCRCVNQPGMVSSCRSPYAAACTAWEGVNIVKCILPHWISGCRRVAVGNHCLTLNHRETSFNVAWPWRSSILPLVTGGTSTGTSSAVCAGEIPPYIACSNLSLVSQIDVFSRCPSTSATTPMQRTVLVARRRSVSASGVALQNAASVVA